MRTDHRAEPFSEYLLYDLPTEQYKGVVFENMGEMWWGCLHRRPGTREDYAIRTDAVYGLDWDTGTAIKFDSGGFAADELPRMAEWQDANTLWVLTHSEHPGLYRVTFSGRPGKPLDALPLTRPSLTLGPTSPPGCEVQRRVSVERVVGFAPPERKIGYAHMPSALMVTPGGRIWAAMHPGLLIVFFDPPRGDLRFIRNEGALSKPPKVGFHSEAVVIGNEAYDVETAERLPGMPPLPPHKRLERWLDKVVGEDGRLYDANPQSGALSLWGEKPPFHLIPPTPGSEARWDASIAWHATHGECAYGTSRFSDPNVELIVYHAPSKRITRKRLDWQPAKPQKLYSMHIGPDGAIYGSNYSLAMWRADPTTGACETLGWAVPPRAGGEIWCFVNVGQRFYFGAYTNSWLSVYDPARPWSPGVTPENNPYNILRLSDHAPDQHRPRALALGADGLVYLASCADYGLTRDGALAALDPKTNRLARVWCPLVKDQQLISLAAHPVRPELCVGTYRGGWWTSATDGALAVLDLKSGEVVRRFDFRNTVQYLAWDGVGSVLAGVVRKDWTVFFYDPKTGECSKPELLGGFKTFFIGPRPSRGTFLVYQQGRMFEMDPATRALTPISPDGVEIVGSDFQEATDGWVYFRSVDEYDICRFRPIQPDRPAGGSP